MAANLIFEPQTDITVYELALLMKLVIASQQRFQSVERVFEGLPLAALRHLKGPDVEQRSAELKAVEP